MDRVSLVLAVAPSLEEALQRVPGCKVGTSAGMPSILLGGADFFAWPLGALEEMRLYLVTPSSDDWERGPELYRILRKGALAEPRSIGGPWSPLEFARFYPKESESCFGSGEEFHLPHVVEGMDPGEAAKFDYSPSDDEVRSDTRPDPAKIFAAKILPMWTADPFNP